MHCRFVPYRDPFPAAPEDLLSLLQVAIDYNKHAHGRYRVCEAADSLEFGTFEPKRFEIPLSEITQVFGPASAGPEQCLADATFDVSPKSLLLHWLKTVRQSEMAPASLQSNSN